MDERIRNAIGKALYEATLTYDDSRAVRWEDMIFKDEWIRKAEEVVKAYLAIKDAIERVEGPGEP